MKDRRIVLVGFMGCGKTTVAKELARRLDCHFADLDTFITETEGRSPAKIIQEDGEPEFRGIETRALESVLKQTDHHVISLGGGTWTIEANRTLIARENCLSVWLDAPFELCWKRISASSELRPMATDRAVARTMFDVRRTSYALSNLCVAVNEDKRPQALAEEIVECLNRPAPQSLI